MLITMKIYRCHERYHHGQVQLDCSFYPKPSKKAANPYPVISHPPILITSNILIPMNLPTRTSLTQSTPSSLFLQNLSPPPTNFPPFHQYFHHRQRHREYNFQTMSTLQTRQSTIGQRYIWQGRYEFSSFTPFGFHHFKERTDWGRCVEAQRAFKAAASEHKIYKVEAGRLERIERGLFYSWL